MPSRTLLLLDIYHIQKFCSRNTILKSNGTWNMTDQEQKNKSSKNAQQVKPVSDLLKEQLRLNVIFVSFCSLEKFHFTFHLSQWNKYLWGFFNWVPSHSQRISILLMRKKYILHGLYHSPEIFLAFSQHLGTPKWNKTFFNKSEDEGLQQQ